MEGEENLQIGNRLWLWRRVTTVGQPKDLVEFDIQKNISAVLLGVTPYQKSRNDESQKKVDATQSGTGQKKVILELSELLDIDETICFELFTKWLLNEYRGSSDSLINCLKDERSRYNLLLKLVSFYYSDRMYTHLILKHIISHAHNHQHPYQSVYADCLDKLDAKAKDRVYKTLLTEYEVLADREPTVLYDSAIKYLQTDEFITSWCYHSLKEQIVVLESLLLQVYYNPNNDKTNLLELVGKFKTRALTGQVSAIKHLLSDIHKPLIKRLEHLQVMIIIVAMNLSEQGLESQTNQSESSSPETLKKLDMMFVSRLGDYQSHSPLQLSWALIRYQQLQQHSTTAAGELVGKLGESALRLDVLSYLLQLVNNLEEQELCDQLIMITVYQLLTRVLTLFDDAALDDGVSLVPLICKLLKNPTIAETVIELEEDDGIYRFIQSAMQSFPLNFHPPVDMLSSLAESSKVAAAHVVRILVEVPTITEYLDSNSQLNVEIISDTEVMLTQPKPLYGDLQLPAHTAGLLADVDGPPTVQWQFSINAWELLSYELVMVCSQTHLVADINVQRRIMGITNLMASTFKHAAISGLPAELVHDSLYRILHSLCCLEVPPLEVISSCIDLATSMSLFSPLPVVENMSVTFLPHIISMPVHITTGSGFKVWEAEVERSLMGHILYGTECVNFRYPVLISSLKFICQTLMSSANKSCDQQVRQRLAASVLYVLRDVFNSYSTWRYSDTRERDIIAELCIEMIHQIINQISITQDTPTDHMSDQLTEVCTGTLLYTSVGHVLLDMISIGSDMLDLIVLEQSSLEVSSCLSRPGYPAAVYRIGLCLSLLRRLLFVAQTKTGDTVLECFLSTHQTPAGSASPQYNISRLVSQYTYHRHHVRLSILSTQLLTLISQQDKLSLLSSFGDDALSTKAGLLRRLASRTEDPRFKVVVVELLTTCVEKQPGLLELFLADSDDEEKLLTVIQSLIESDKQFSHICPAELLLSCLNFILALWSAGRVMVTEQLSSSESFWKTVLAPLKRKIGDISSGSESHPLKAKIYCNVLEILAYQLYARDVNNKVFKKIITSVDPNKWTDLSKFVQIQLMDIANIEASTVSESTASDVTLRHVAAVRLLDSYRMFISTVLIAEPNLFSTDSCMDMLNNILETLTQLVEVDEAMSSKTQVTLASMISSLHYELLNKWHKSLQDWQASYEKLAHILYKLTSGGTDTRLLPSILVGVVSSLHLLTDKKSRSQSISSSKISASTADCMESVLHSITNLLPTCSNKLADDVPETDKRADGLKKLRLVSLAALYELIHKLPESVWIPRLHESYLILSLVDSLAHCIKNAADLPYAELSLSFLTQLSMKQITAKLVSSVVSEHLTLGVSVLYSNNSEGVISPVADVADSKSAPGSPRDNKGWQALLHHITDMFSQLLTSLTYMYVSEGSSYVAVHSDRILQLMETVTMSLTLGDLQELKSYCHLITCLSAHRHQWITETSAQSVRLMVTGMRYLLQDCVALLHRPKAVRHIILKKSGHLLLQRQQKMDNEDMVEYTAVRNLLLDILIECCSCLKNFNPDLCVTLADVTFDPTSYDAQVVFEFKSPSLENRTPPSFGTLISTTDLCIGLLTKSDRSPSRNLILEEDIELLRPKLLYVLELTLYLIMSQVLLYLRANVLSQKDVNKLKREISTELNSCISGIHRYFRKQSPASPSRSVTSPGVNTATASSSRSMVSPRSARSMHSPFFNNLAEHGMFKLVDEFVKKVLK